VRLRPLKACRDLNLGAEALLVELHRVATVAVEVKIGRNGFHGESFSVGESVKS
jgi:hypothetical protein